MDESSLRADDRKALHFVRTYCARHERAPSYVEVGRHLGLEHPNNAKRNCDRLVRGGFLARAQIGGGAAGRPRALGATGAVGNPLVYPYRGRVSCGRPGEGDNCDDETIDFRNVLPRMDGLAVYRARGQSMIDAYIADGDLLLVEEVPDPDEGATVVALLGRDLVCKRLAKKGPGRVVLEPCNGSMQPIEVDPGRTNFSILGVLRNVVRKI